jgi:hypothetical protein
MSGMARSSVPVGLTALGLLLGLAACAQQARLHPGFDFAVFRRSPTAFGGVANLVHDPALGRDSPQQINAAMEGAFMAKRRDLRFVPASVFRERIGEERYAGLLDRYRDGAGIDTSAYLMLAQAMGLDARYLALARIESVTVTHSRTTADPDYNVRTDNDNVIKSTERNVWITFNLFDLEAQREIWSETRAASAINKVTFPEQTGTGTWALIKAIFTSEPDYPPARPAYEALDKGFSYFAGSIPKR